MYLFVGCGRRERLEVGVVRREMGVALMGAQDVALLVEGYV